MGGPVARPERAGPAADPRRRWPRRSSGALWIPVIRRWLGTFGVRRRRTGRVLTAAAGATVRRVTTDRPPDGPLRDAAGTPGRSSRPRLARSCSASARGPIPRIRAIRACPSWPVAASSRGRPDAERTPSRPTTGLDAPRPRAYPPPPHPKTGYERDEYPSSVGRETRWLVETGATAAANGPGSLRTERRARRRRGASPVGSGAERQRYRAAPIGGTGDGPRPPVGHGVRHRRMRVAPRKARPFVPGRQVVS